MCVKIPVQFSVRDGIRAEENFLEFDPKCEISSIVLFCVLSSEISTDAFVRVLECYIDIFA